METLFEIKCVDEGCKMLCANMAGCTRSTHRKIITTVDDAVKYECYFILYQVLKPRTNCGWCLHTNLAGFTDIMKIATIDMHYSI